MPDQGDKRDMNIAVFASGEGTNLQALIDSGERKELGKGKITLVVSDKPGAFALKRAEGKGIKTFVLEVRLFPSREEYDREIIKKLKEEKIDLIVLAGFMRLLSPFFVDEYEGRILNIHPALLPSFKGTHAIKDALLHGVKVTGVTVHFVNKELDDGPIMLQEEVGIKETDTEESLEERIHKVEHKLYPEAVKLFTEGKIKIEGRKVKILE